MSVEVITHKEWIERARERYGNDSAKWEFKCPACGHVQSIAGAVERDPDIDSEAAQNWIYFACEGRHNHEVGCNWTLGGLFTIHEREVEPHPDDPDKKNVAVMLFGDEEYQSKPSREPAEAKAALPYVETAGYRLPRLELREDVAIGTVEYYHFKFNRGWAIFIVNNETGEFSVQSDWGNYAYRWSTDPQCLGEPTLAQFIARTSPGYIVDKFASNEPRDFREQMDAEGTEQNIRKKILEARREHRLDQEEAADLWSMVRDVDFDGADSFMYTLGSGNELADFLGEEPWYDIQTKPSHAYCFLREILLPFFIRWLKGHLREERRAAS
jgi:hypothetical protein